MTYAEELQVQVQEKKRKEALAKQKQEQEDLVQEARIKEEIESEKLIAEEKKKQGDALGGGKVRFSPVVKTRKEAAKQKAREPSQYGQSQHGSPQKSQHSPAKSNAPSNPNPYTYHVKDQNQQLQEKKIEMENFERR